MLTDDKINKKISDFQSLLVAILLNNYNTGLIVMNFHYQVYERVKYT